MNDSRSGRTPETPVPWEAGRTVVVQHVWQGRVFSALPMQVVEDNGESFRLWSPNGSEMRMAWTPPERSRPEATRLETLVDCLTHGDWVHFEYALPVSSLWLFEKGPGYALAYFWSAEWEPIGWYVNLQEPFTRSGDRIQTMDLALDVIVDTSLRWAWKDEDEFEALIEAGLLEPAKASDIRGQGLEAIARLEARASPFSEPWQDWRPDPSWRLPKLPEDWQVT